MSVVTSIEAGRERKTYALTDAGNAERFAAQHQDRARYVGAWKKWIVFDGKCWRVDDRNAVLLLAKETARALDAEIQSATDSEDRKALRKHATYSESRKGLEAMAALARAECGVSTTDLDRDPWLYNVQNGTIDLRTGELRPHDPADLITRVANVHFNPQAKAPGWDAFLNWAMAGNEGLITHLQRLAGYSLAGIPSEHVLAFSFGHGRNGKSVFHNVLAKVHGDYFRKAPRGLLVESRHERHPTEIATLFGARFVWLPETKEGQHFDEAMVKDLTSEEPLTARGMNENFWTFTPTHTLFLCGNHKPVVKGNDEGIWRRMLLIPWTVQIPEEQRDLHLAAKLEAESAGILAWMLRGCLDWQREGLSRPPEVAKATAEYRQESNALHEFLTARCELDPEAKVPRKFLRAAYEAWCKDVGMHPVGARRFAQDLTARGVADGSTMRANGLMLDAWKGIRLRPSAESDLPGDSL